MSRYRLSTLILLLAGALVLATPSPAPAQSGGRAQETSPFYDRFDLEFRGGTLEAYLSAVRTASGFSNIVVAGPADRLPMPAVTLERITVLDAVALVDSLPAEPNVDVDVDKLDNALVVSVQDRARRAKPLTDESSVWSLTGLISDDMPAEDILTAVEAGIGLLDGESEIRYHDETQLLIVRGPERHLTMVHSLISELKVSVSRKNASSEMKSRAEAFDNMKHEIEASRERILQLEMAVENAQVASIEFRERARSLQAMLDDERAKSADALAHQKMSSQTRIHELQSMVARLESALAEQSR